MNTGEKPLLGRTGRIQRQVRRFIWAARSGRRRPARLWNGRTQGSGTTSTASGTGNRSEGRRDGSWCGSASRAWVSGYVKQSKNGKKYLDLRYKPQAEKIDRSRPLKDDLADEVPW
jgi:hypothetical protein